jgi:hypothetical protein
MTTLIKHYPASCFHQTGAPTGGHAHVRGRPSTSSHGNWTVIERGWHFLAQRRAFHGKRSSLAVALRPADCVERAAGPGRRERYREFMVSASAGFHGDQPVSASSLHLS